MYRRVDCALEKATCASGVVCFITHTTCAVPLRPAARGKCLLNALYFRISGERGQ